ncbi:undecaprenyl-phosphate glucose phosphotransferase [Thiocystis minor]|uniref:sugar transferase n=1 Tax=Thiocystis minor TaxID=61597 RepID=UPI00191365FA|nr:sugar transferase [Thiocystis minor]MBK5965892.1 undecaprenyl-phosphate glucose phosphotransferase [Thiocystis minor]
MNDDGIAGVLNQVHRGVRLRQHQSLVTFIQRAFDILTITLCLWAAFVLTGTPWIVEFNVTAALAVGFFSIFADIKNIYRSWRTGSIFTEILYTLEAWLAVFAILFISGYLWPETAYPREVMLSWLLATPVLLAASRFGVRQILRIVRMHGVNTRLLAIVGTGQISHHFSRTIAANPWMGFRTVGIFDEIADEDSGENGALDFPVESVDSLVKLARNGEVDTVFIAMPLAEEAAKINQLLLRLSDSTASVYIVQDRRERKRSRQMGIARSDDAISVTAARMEHDLLHRCWMEIDGIPAFSVYESPFLGVTGWVKRVEDLLLGTIAIVLLAIPMIVIAIGVKRSGPGPIIFKQRRYGLAGEQIMVWKFRSMSVCENGDLVAQATKKDSRITPFGSFIRRTSLDELPQFINVLQGSMSIVGPRPHAVAHNEYYRPLVGGYMLRHKVKPGITGLAQVNGWRGETETLDKMAMRVQFDLEYIRNWSLWLDIKILIRTIFNGFVHENAY